MPGIAGAESLLRFQTILGANTKREKGRGREEVLGPSNCGGGRHLSKGPMAREGKFGKRRREIKWN